MENYINILKQIKKEGEVIKKETANICQLEYDDARKAALDAHDMPRYKELLAAAENNAGRVKALSERIYKREIKQRVLAENARAAVFHEGYNVIVEACKPYEGKPYGEKTREKIAAKVREAGFGFWFHDSSGGSYQLTLYTLDNNHGGCRTGNSIEAEVFASNGAGATEYFITGDNLINISNVLPAPRDHYTENITGTVNEIYKAIKAHEAIIEKARDSYHYLTTILPEGIERPKYIDSYHPTFWREFSM